MDKRRVIPISIRTRSRDALRLWRNTEFASRKSICRLERKGRRQRPGFRTRGSASLPNDVVITPLVQDSDKASGAEKIRSSLSCAASAVRHVYNPNPIFGIWL